MQTCHWRSCAPNEVVPPLMISTMPTLAASLS